MPNKIERRSIREMIDLYNSKNYYHAELTPSTDLAPTYNNVPNKKIQISRNLVKDLIARIESGDTKPPPPPKTDYRRFLSTPHERVTIEEDMVKTRIQLFTKPDAQPNLNNMNRSQSTPHDKRYSAPVRKEGFLSLRNHFEVNQSESVELSDSDDEELTESNHLHDKDKGHSIISNYEQVLSDSSQASGQFDLPSTSTEENNTRLVTNEVTVLANMNGRSDTAEIDGKFEEILCQYGITDTGEFEEKFDKRRSYEIDWDAGYDLSDDGEFESITSNYGITDPTHEEEPTTNDEISSKIQNVSKYTQICWVNPNQSELQDVQDSSSSILERRLSSENIEPTPSTSWDLGLKIQAADDVTKEEISLTIQNQADSKYAQICWLNPINPNSSELQDVQDSSIFILERRLSSENIEPTPERRLSSENIEPTPTTNLDLGLETQAANDVPKKEISSTIQNEDDSKYTQICWLNPNSSELQDVQDSSSSILEARLSSENIESTPTTNLDLGLKSQAADDVTKAEISSTIQNEDDSKYTQICGLNPNPSEFQDVQDSSSSILERRLSSENIEPTPTNNLDFRLENQAEDVTKKEVSSTIQNEDDSKYVQISGLNPNLSELQDVQDSSSSILERRLSSENIEPTPTTNLDLGLENQAADDVPKEEISSTIQNEDDSKYTQICWLNPEFDSKYTQICWLNPNSSELQDVQDSSSSILERRLSSENIEPTPTSNLDLGLKNQAADDVTKEEISLTIQNQADSKYAQISSRCPTPTSSLDLGLQHQAADDVPKEKMSSTIQNEDDTKYVQISGLNPNPSELQDVQDSYSSILERRLSSENIEPTPTYSSILDLRLSSENIEPTPTSNLDLGLETQAANDVPKKEISSTIQNEDDSKYVQISSRCPRFLQFYSRILERRLSSENIEPTPTTSLDLGLENQAADDVPKEEISSTIQNEDDSKYIQICWLNPNPSELQDVQDSSSSILERRLSSENIEPTPTTNLDLELENQAADDLENQAADDITKEEIPSTIQNQADSKHAQICWLNPNLSELQDVQDSSSSILERRLSSENIEPTPTSSLDLGLQHQAADDVPKEKMSSTIQNEDDSKYVQICGLNSNLSELQDVQDSSNSILERRLSSENIEPTPTTSLDLGLKNQAADDVSKEEISSTIQNEDDSKYVQICWLNPNPSELQDVQHSSKSIPEEILVSDNIDTTPISSLDSGLEDLKSEEEEYNQIIGLNPEENISSLTQNQDESKYVQTCLNLSEPQDDQNSSRSIPERRLSSENIAPTSSSSLGLSLKDSKLGKEECTEIIGLDPEVNHQVEDKVSENIEPTPSCSLDLTDSHPAVDEDLEMPRMPITTIIKLFESKCLNTARRPSLGDVRSIRTNFNHHKRRNSSADIKQPIRDKPNFERKKSDNNEAITKINIDKLRSIFDRQKGEKFKNINLLRNKLVHNEAITYAPKILDDVAVDTEDVRDLVQFYHKLFENLANPAFVLMSVYSMIYLVNELIKFLLYVFSIFC
ncbi:hypothetical protein QE152_g23204 [Popillia japonica]|uniref:Uncharacterized protein n=1 Tax=Popillia japonica TaxID=7064 RepID=A0AAW1KHN5_POPJA